MSPLKTIQESGTAIAEKADRTYCYKWKSAFDAFLFWCITSVRPLCT